MRQFIVFYIVVIFSIISPVIAAPNNQTEILQLVEQLQKQRQKESDAEFSKNFTLVATALGILAGIIALAKLILDINNVIRGLESNQKIGRTELSQQIQELSMKLTHVSATTEKHLNALENNIATNSEFLESRINTIRSEMEKAIGQLNDLLVRIRILEANKHQ